MTGGSSSTQMMQQIRTENIKVSQDIYNITTHITHWLRKKYWKDKQILALVKELEQSNEEFRKETIPDIQVTDKIYWKDKGKISGKAEDRNSKPTGNIQWRKEGFSKQTIET